MAKKWYTVAVNQVIERKFTLEANTPEEAASIAEDYVKDGEPGEIGVVDMLETDVVETEAESL